MGCGLMFGETTLDVQLRRDYLARFTVVQGKGMFPSTIAPSLLS